MDLKTSIDARYVRAFVPALVLQLAIALGCGMVLDLGMLSRLCAIVMLAFWVGVFISVARRPTSPTSLQLLAIRYGFLPLLVLAFCYARYLLRIM